MATQTTVKEKVFFVLLALTAVGLFAADPSHPAGERTIEIAPPDVPPALRGLHTIPMPRECDLKRGIDSACTFI